jgi:hypothetical protein
VLVDLELERGTTMQQVLDSNPFVGPVLVTVAYLIFWYYLLAGLQRKTKYRLKKEYEDQGKVFDRYFGQDEQMLAVDRAVINTQEQMVPFIAALWMFSAFVSPSIATLLGTVYIVLRFFYPLLIGKRLSKIQPKRVYFVTLPCYLIIFYMLGATVWAALT